MKLIFGLLFSIEILAGCARKHTFGAGQHVKEENRKSNKDNFLLCQKTEERKAQTKDG